MTARKTAEKIPFPPRLKDAEKLLGPARKWAGHCYEIATAFVDRGLVEGEPEGAGAQAGGRQVELGGLEHAPRGELLALEAGDLRRHLDVAEVQHRRAHRAPRPEKICPGAG